jgi:hypothetical protein
MNSGVDIYPGNDFGGEAPSPIKGKVIQIRKVKAPKGQGFAASDHDTLIIIENKQNPETVTKILHIDPLVGVGDCINVGDPLGITLRSGYYGWGTSPHIHAEIRSSLDPIRARGGYHLNMIEVPQGESVNEIAGIVVHHQPEFALIQLKSKGVGLVGSVNGNPATLDGGIPYYGWLGAHLTEVDSSGTIELLGKPIADITQTFKKSNIGLCREYQFIIEDKPILGLSLNLWPISPPIVKIIPLKIDGLHVEMGDWIEVKLRI